jgi:hypothetical protein
MELGGVYVSPNTVTIVIFIDPRWAGCDLGWSERMHTEFLWVNLYLKNYYECEYKL